jgi:putative transposase
VIDLALEAPDLSPRELAVKCTDTKGYFVSEASVYRLLKAHDLITSPAFVVIKAADKFCDKTTRYNQKWQADFTYGHRLGPVLPVDHSGRLFPLHRRLETIRHHAGRGTLTLALKASGCDQVEVDHRPRLLSVNRSSYIASDLAEWLEEKGMDHVHGAPNHPQTQDKIVRWHQTQKNRILLQNYFLLGDLKTNVQGFVAHYDHHRYHESIGNLTPTGVYYGRGNAILELRAKIKKRTIEHRRLCRQSQAALYLHTKS